MTVTSSVSTIALRTFPIFQGLGDDRLAAVLGAQTGLYPDVWQRSCLLSCGGGTGAAQNQQGANGYGT